MTLVQARPRALLAAADVGDEHTARWRRDAAELAAAIAAFRRGAVDVGAVVPDLDVAILALADRTAALDAELRAVGAAFLSLDVPADVIATSELQLEYLLAPARCRDVGSEIAALRAMVADRHLDARGRAQAVRALLDGLPRSVWFDLVHADPALLGNTDGVPVELRYLANRATMTAALRAAERERTLRRSAGLPRDDRLDGRIDNLRRLLTTGYEYARAAGGAPELRLRQVLAFDPGGDGRVVEVYGDLAAATTVATFVPGITNRLDNFHHTSQHAADLYAHASRLARGEGTGDVATIAWLGYDTPELVDAPSRIRADRWAPALAAFQAALPTSLGHPDARTTVIGHSYGSLVTGIAIREDGLRADAFAVIGSPGMNVAHAAQLGLPDDVPLYAGRASGDLVSLSEAHGTDPAKPYFGAIPFETGAISGHSRYTEPSSVSLANLAVITLGRGEVVTRDGWTLADVPSAPVRAVAVATFPVIGGVLAGYEVVDEIVIGARDAAATVRELVLDTRDLAAGAVAAVDRTWDGVSGAVLDGVDEAWAWTPWGGE